MLTPWLWTTGSNGYQPADLPIAIAGAAWASDGQKLWIFGGLSGAAWGTELTSVYSLDPVANTWASHPVLPSTVYPYARAAIVDGVAYIMDTGVFWAYDLATGVTDQTLTAPAGGAAFGHPLVAHDGLIYWKLGAQAPQVYNPTTDTWTAITAWPTLDSDYTASDAVSDGTRIYVGATTLFGRYDPATDSWIDLPDMAASIPHRTAAYRPIEVFDGELLAFGGYDSGAGVTFATMSRLDLETEAWTQLGDLPSEIDAIHSVVIDGRIYLAGGEGDAPTDQLWTWASTAPIPTVLNVKHTVGWPTEATLNLAWTTPRIGNADAGGTLRVVHSTLATVTARVGLTHAVTPDPDDAAAVPTVGPTITGSIEERLGAGVTATLETIGDTPADATRADFMQTRVRSDGTIIQTHVGRNLYTTAHTTSWETRGGVPVSTISSVDPSQRLESTILPELVRGPLRTDTGITWGVGEDAGGLYALSVGLGVGVTSADDCAARDPIAGTLRQTRLELAHEVVNEAGMALVTLGSIPNATRVVERDFTTKGRTAAEVLADLLLASNPRVWYTPTTVTIDARAFTPVATVTDLDTILPADDRADDGASWTEQAAQTEPEPVLSDYTDQCERRNPDATPGDDEAVVPGTFETFDDGVYQWTERSGSGDDLRTTRNAIRKANGRVVEEVTEASGYYRQSFDSQLRQFGIVNQEIVRNTYHPDCPEALTFRTERNLQRKSIEDIPNVSNTVGTTEDGPFNPTEEQRWIFDALPTWWVQEAKELRQVWHAEGWLRTRSETTRSLEGMIASPTFEQVWDGSQFTDGSQDGYDITLTYKTETRSETYIPVGNGLWWIRTLTERVESKPVYEPVNPDAVDGDPDYGVMEVAGVSRQPVQHSYTEVTDRAPSSVSCGELEGDDPCSDEDPYDACIAEQTRRYQIDHADWLARQRHNAAKRIWTVTGNRLLPEYHLGQVHAGGIIAGITHDLNAESGRTTLEVWQWLE